MAGEKICYAGGKYKYDRGGVDIMMCSEIGNAVMQCLSEKGTVTSPMVVAGGFIRHRREAHQSVDEAYRKAGTALLRGDCLVFPQVE